MTVLLERYIESVIRSKSTEMHKSLSERQT